MPTRRYTEGIRRREDLPGAFGSSHLPQWCSVVLLLFGSLSPLESFLRLRAFGAPQVETVLVCSMVYNCYREYLDQMSYVRVAFSVLHDETVSSCHLGCWFGL